MGIELKEQSLVARLQQLARQQGGGPEQVLEDAVRDYLDRYEKEAIHRETEYFWAIHTDLLEKFAGEYVALHSGQVVDHDREVSRLEKRVRQRFGWLPVLIAPVRPGSRKELLWRGNRIDRTTPQ
jgi:hypothetical protein